MAKCCYNLLFLPRVHVVWQILHFTDEFLQQTFTGIKRPVFHQNQEFWIWTLGFETCFTLHRRASLTSPFSAFLLSVLHNASRCAAADFFFRSFSHSLSKLARVCMTFPFFRDFLLITVETKPVTSGKSFLGWVSQTVFFGGAKQQATYLSVEMKSPRRCVRVRFHLEIYDISSNSRSEDQWKTLWVTDALLWRVATLREQTDLHYKNIAFWVYLFLLWAISFCREWFAFAVTVKRIPRTYM